jgi:hypothetical protein
MVTNRDRKSLGSHQKNSTVCSDACSIKVFYARSGIPGPISRRASVCPNLHECGTQPAKVRCSAIDSAKIWSLPRLGKKSDQ